ncbi:ECF transporter S component [Alicyclobacillus tolerans]|uniref:Energy-coupling factor transport system substrate-specific component n=1 Tax=Alicyclobacillus tolerans TaxID=90970 RepID=A0ABT9LTP1_9BACL|nr:ECF transporter S component [Alicyclobacillus tengchongensis]MDP9727633.1 energy-coupling factor transport system substrate-specific component [Alicyclobacillus tengchongensis]
MSWKLRDIVLLAILAVVSGLIFRIFDFLYNILQIGNIVWPPGQNILNGVWFIAVGLVPYIIRKPGAALLAEVLAAVVEWALAGPYGISGVLSGLLQGLGGELAYLFFAYRRYNLGVLSLSGALAGVGYAVQYYYQYGGNHLTHLDFILAVLINCISGVFFAGFVPKWIDDALARTGLLRNYAIGQRAKGISQ